MEVKRLRVLAVGKFKTINNINTSYIINTFTFKANTKICQKSITNFPSQQETFKSIGTKMM